MDDPRDQGMANAYDALERTAPHEPLSIDLPSDVAVPEGFDELTSSFDAGAEDGVYAAEFDLMFRPRLVAALNAAGPSTAMADRVLQNLLAAQREGSATGAHFGSGAGNGGLANEAVQNAVATAPSAAMLSADAGFAAAAPETAYAEPAHMTSEDMASEAAFAEGQAPAHLVLEPSAPQVAAPALQDDFTGGASAAGDPGQQSRSLSYLQRIRGGLSIFERDRRTLSIAATVLGAIIVVGVARAVVGAMFGGHPSSAAAPTLQASGEQANDARVETVDEAEEVAAESAADTGDWQALACPSVDLSSGETLELVIGEHGPEKVDPTAVGEFVEPGRAYGSEDELPCDIYRLIVQSEGDGALYAISYADDGSFYLARPKA